VLHVSDTALAAEYYDIEFSRPASGVYGVSRVLASSYRHDSANAAAATATGIGDISGLM